MPSRTCSNLQVALSRSIQLTASSARSPLAGRRPFFDIEREISGRSADERVAVRRARVASLVAQLQEWMRAQRGKLSRHSDVGKAMDYMLKRWDTFTRFLHDGHICLTNNAAARGLRGIAITESFYTSSSSICKH